MGSDPRKRMACGWRRIVGTMLCGSLMPSITAAGALGSPSPYVSPPTTGNLMTGGLPAAPSFEELRAKLTSFGMLDYQLQGNAQVGYSFIGHFLDPQHADVMKTRESKGP